MVQFIEAMTYRHATKEFNPDKKISDSEMKEILEVGRLSPSSFGFEPWKFLVIENRELKKKITPACFNQKQIESSSAVVIYLSTKKNLKPQSTYLKELLKPRMPEEVVKFILNMHEGMVSNFSEDKFNMWVKAQSYIAATNMMTYAASIKIDSCPMEGFDEEQVLDILGLNKEEYGVALIVPFGYRNSEPREKTRRAFEDVVEFRK